MGDDKGGEQDERHAYGELDALEQKAIRFLLDCAASRQGFEPLGYEWLAEDRNNVWQYAQRLAAYDCLRAVPQAKAKLAEPQSRTDAGLNASGFFGDAMTIAVFVLRNGFIQTFDAFDFLFVRIFGGLVRPLTPSLFAASLLHPDVYMGEKDAEQLERAMMAHRSGPNTHEPVWFPDHPISPPVG